MSETSQKYYVRNANETKKVQEKKGSRLFSFHATSKSIISIPWTKP